MPALSPTMSEGVINKWLVNIGDTVSAGDILQKLKQIKQQWKLKQLMRENYSFN